MAELLLFSLVCSSLILLATGMACRSSSGVRGACWTSLVLTLLTVCLGSFVLPLQSFGILIAGLICLACKATRKTMFLSSVGVTVLSYAIVLVSSLSELREYERLRQEFPVQSMADRLSYEQRLSSPSVADAAIAELPLHPDVEFRLKMREDEGGNTRRYMLQRLHDRTADEFVIAQGFGPVRMVRVRRERIELPETPPVPLPPLQPDEPQYDSNGSVLPLAAEAAPVDAVLRGGLLDVHLGGLQQFTDPERTGYARDRDHVMGFQSHRFVAIPEFPRQQADTSTWQVTRLELVSLLKHEIPVAYVSQHLPQMDELKNVPTRRLDDFEQDALPRLRTGEDLAIENGGGRIRMLGSVRAGKNCLACHSVSRGELLGAFSYELRRVGSNPARPHPDSPGPQARFTGDAIPMRTASASRADISSPGRALVMLRRPHRPDREPARGTLHASAHRWGAVLSRSLCFCGSTAEREDLV